MTVTDEHGAAATQPVIVTVTGTNDTPTITSDTAAATRAFSEQSNTPPPNPTNSTSPDPTGGTITFRDVDLTDTHRSSQSAPVFVSSHGALTLQQQADLTAASTLHLTETDSTGTGAGSIAYAYSAQDKTFDFLAQDETLTITYNVTVTDEHGAAATQPVIVTVTGTNDPPTITSTAAATRACLSEREYAAAQSGDSIADQTGGTITFRDVDLTDTHQKQPERPGLWCGRMAR